MLIKLSDADHQIDRIVEVITYYLIQFNPIKAQLKNQLLLIHNFFFVFLCINYI